MIYYRKNLNKLVYEDINDKYGYGKYEDFEVVIRKIDGYINVSKLCKDGNKDFNQWKRTTHAQISIQSVKNYHNIPEDKVLELVHGGANYKISGTYAHPALVPHIASWVSVDFFNMVSDVVNNHIVNKYEEELKEKEYQLRKKDEIIKEKEDTISDLKNYIRDKFSEMKDGNDKILGELKVSNNTIVELNTNLQVANTNITDLKENLQVANENIINLNQNVNEVVETLKYTCNERVPLERMNDLEKEVFIIFYTGREDKQFSSRRRQTKSINTLIKTLKNSYENLREVVRFDNQPNPVESWNACKKDPYLREHMEWDKNNNFTLIDITEEEFLKRVSEIVEDVRLKPYEEIKEKVNVENLEKNEIEDENIKRDERIRELFGLTIPKLKELCKQKNLKKYHKLNKNDLIHFIVENE